MPDRTEIAPGVMREVSYTRAIYSGTAEALVAAGLADARQFPGQPGMPRGMCCFDPDGDRITQGRHGRNRTGPGHTRIIARPRGVFAVEIRLSSERLGAIEAEQVQASRCWPFPQINGAPVSMALIGRQPVVQGAEVFA